MRASGEHFMKIDEMGRTGTLWVELGHLGENWDSFVKIRKKTENSTEFLKMLRLNYYIVNCS